MYEHWRPDKDVCFYVGKGTGDRVTLTKRPENRHYFNVVRKLARLGMCVEVRMVASGLTNQEALVLEVERIAFWLDAGVKLANKTPGGQGGGMIGRSHKEKTRKKISQALLGHGFSEESLVKMRGPRGCSEKMKAALQATAAKKKGKIRGPLPVETRQKISAKLTGRKCNPLSVAQGACKRTGCKRGPMSQAQRTLLSEVHRERFARNPELKVVLSEKNKGKVHSAETRRKMAESQVKRWEKRKALVIEQG